MHNMQNVQNVAQTPSINNNTFYHRCRC